MTYNSFYDHTVDFYEGDPSDELLYQTKLQYLNQSDISLYLRSKPLWALNTNTALESLFANKTGFQCNIQFMSLYLIFNEGLFLATRLECKQVCLFSMQKV